MVTLCEKTFTVTLTTHQCLLDSVNMYHSYYVCKC